MTYDKDRGIADGAAIHGKRDGTAPSEMPLSLSYVTINVLLRQGPLLWYLLRTTPSAGCSAFAPPYVPLGGRASATQYGTSPVP